VAREYHAQLQKEPEWTQERETATERILSHIDKKISAEDRELLEQLTTYDDLEKALASALNDTAPGLDGIPWEFYKHFHQRANNKENLPDILNIIKQLLNYLEETGNIDKEFTHGQMALVYKKGDKREIANYKPLTLLNTDLKL
jgi:predicted  nucleic acid-binding Zn-ribbon protein